MTPLLRLEFDRALHCPTFVISVAVGSMLAVVAAVECIWRYRYSHEWGDPYLETTFLKHECP